MSKDFVPSTEYEASDQSIPSFAGTLPDDVLYYPDSISTDPLFATGGDTGYDNTYDVDSTYFQLGASESKILEFDYLGPINYFTWAVYGYSDDAVLLDYSDDGIDWTYFEIITTVGWFNGTENDVSLDDTGTFYILFDTTGMSGGPSYIDYVEIVIGFMAGPSDGYAESFADVSDFTTDDTSISSDGDLGTITENGEGSTGRAYASFSSTDFFEYYYEFGIESMTATTANLEFWDGSAYNTLKTFTALGTYKGIISDSDATTMQRIGFLVGSNGGNIKPDYLRIGSADEMGWQHDGSTTAGTEPQDTIVTTDGDKLNISNSEGTTKACNIWIDKTATKSTQSDTYYPFVEWSVSSVSDTSNTWKLRVYDSDGTYSEIQALSYETGIFRKNLASITDLDDIEYFLFYVTTGHWFELDYIKVYSIANFTYSGSGVGTDDYLYVDSGVLYSNIDSGYIETNHDPALSIVTGVNSLWALTTSSGTPESDYYVSAWTGYSSDTEGALANGTLTDLKLKFTDDANVAAITFFIAPPQWYESGEAELIFTVPLDETGLNMLLIFLGLIMIPLSTLYLVKGGRSEMSSDKLFYGLIAFVMGWALFLGGIMA
jgi:hypothetical protein